MKPGVSAAMTGVLPMRRARSAVADDTAGSVSGPAITSTSAMTGTGLKKCIPTTRCGRSVASAILRSEIGGGGRHGGVGERTCDHLDQRHDRDGVEEVHPHDPLWPICRFGDPPI